MTDMEHGLSFDEEMPRYTVTASLDEPEAISALERLAGSIEGRWGITGDMLSSYLVPAHEIRAHSYWQPFEIPEEMFRPSMSYNYDGDPCTSWWQFDKPEKKVEPQEVSMIGFG